MARTNRPPKVEAFTAEGARAYAHMTPEQALRRSVLACLLWEKAFYCDGVEIFKRIAELAAQVAPETVAALAIEARQRFHLRHAPLLLLTVLARTGAGSALVADTIEAVITRADEPGEFLALYAMQNGVTPDKLKAKLSAQVKKGLARALRRFDAYELAKYDRDVAVKIRDVMFLVHPKPRDDEQDRLWKQLIAGELQAPDTWEVALSAGQDKREAFERLLREEKLGYLALLRNLRTMVAAGCDAKLVEEAIVARKGARRVLPFRYVAAARACPQMEPALDAALLGQLAQAPKLPGKTIVVVDVSGSMGARLSRKADMARHDVASALGAIARELAERPVIYATAGNDSTRIHKTELVPARRGMALVDAIWAMCAPLGGGGIFLKPVIDFLRERERTADRMIVITDEQDCAIDAADSPLLAKPFGTHNYLINVSVEKNGIGYKPAWTHIDGFSEAVFDFIREHEAADA
ncbi:MAG TPA: TROVE domain-containing protein [Vineibacter sp.]|nr:TROVE domain-containing protein [Vineibacter sp.]